MAYRYLILDSRSQVLGRGLLESPTDSPMWYIRVLEDAVSQVIEHEYLQLLSMDEQAPAKMGRLLKQKEDVIVVEPIEDLSDAVYQNLRVHVKFTSYIYPLTKKWYGRYPVISHDLNCTGMAFFCARRLEVGERLEVIIPITSNPVIVEVEVLRQRPANGQIPLYGVKFMNLIHDQEAALREAVFSQQLASSCLPADGQ